MLTVTKSFKCFGKKDDKTTLLHSNLIRWDIKCINSYNYVGCFANAGDSTLPHLYKGIGYDIEMENSRCILYCKGHGYKYAGTKKGELCFCGDNAYCNGPEKPNNDCDERCSGDLTQVCGAHWRLSVYTTGYRPLNRQNNLFVEFAKDYRFAKKTRQIVRMGNGVVLGCAANCVASITCRAFEVAMETAECSLLHDYESLCEGLQQAIGYTIYTMV
ncbi:unnamed protein product [Mytilus coruscus]|uniref:WSC domain-containing protein n=1 Tax=Mytilus coruscus TaxID=42192 RepID=A0A6J8CJK5_MYTCO|nr:unnamed protein product [Mytilus coruscus]